MSALTHCLSVAGLPQSKPAITGVEKAYNLGDKIEANCTTDKSWPPATVQWFINNQLVRSLLRRAAATTDSAFTFPPN